MRKWKCEICGNTFENFHAQGFNNQIYCPLCYFKKLSADYKLRIDKSIKKLESIKFILDDSNFNVTAKLDVKDKDIKETISILKGEDKE